MLKWDVAAGMALFLTERTGSCLGTWKGRLSAAEQKTLFGSYLFGKKLITLDGASEEVTTTHKVCFGNDYESVHYSWREVISL
jgi:hypothetical protein